MLSRAKTLNSYKLSGFDGEIGKVKEFYFDDRHWAIRYLVADTGNWLASKRVLISPYALVKIITEAKDITVDLTKKQIENSPSLDNDKPVSRQFEEDFYGYYGYPKYWIGPCMWGGYVYPEHDHKKWLKQIQTEEAWDPHLRSSHDLIGHHIHAPDGEIGHVEDLIIDDESWAIRYLIVGTRNWWPGKKVLLSPQWIERVSWSESKVFVNLSRETIKASPEYTEDFRLTRDYETGLHQHYNREGYWVDELAAR